MSMLKSRLFGDYSYQYNAESRRNSNFGKFWLFPYAGRALVKRKKSLAYTRLFSPINNMWCYFSCEKSNDVSKNLVVNLPDLNVGLSINLI